MRFRDALKWSLKYHSLAVFPTLMGLGIVVAAVYLGAVRSVLPVLQSGSLSLDTVAAVVTSVNAPLVLVGVVLGIFTRRVGRTALLVRTQSQAIDAALADATGNSAGAAANGEFGSDSEVGPDDEVGANDEVGADSGDEATRTTETAATDAEYDEFGYGSDDTGSTGKKG